MEVILYDVMSFFINFFVKHLNGSVVSGSFSEVDFHGLFGANGMIWFSKICSGPLKKYIKSFGTSYMIMVGLSGNGR